MDDKRLQKMRRMIAMQVIGPGQSVNLDLATEALLMVDEGKGKTEFLQKAEKVWNLAVETKAAVDAEEQG